jgi:hypothetical protein
VAIGEHVGFDLDDLAGRSLDRKAAAIDRRREVLDYDAVASVAGERYLTGRSG